MEAIILLFMIFSLILIFAIDVAQKGPQNLRRGQKTKRTDTSSSQTINESKQ